MPVHNAPDAIEAIKNLFNWVLNSNYGTYFPDGITVVTLEEEASEAISTGVPYVKLALGKDMAAAWSSGARPRREITVDGEIASNAFTGSWEGVSSAAVRAITDLVTSYPNLFADWGLYLITVEFQAEANTGTAENDDAQHQVPFQLTATYFLS